MARHAAPTAPRHTLLRAGLILTALGTALGAGASAAGAAEPTAPATAKDASDSLAGKGEAAVDGLTGGLTHATTPLTGLKLNPLAGTGVDPLDNSVGTQVADFKPVSTKMITDPVTDGGALKDLPVPAAAGPLTR